MKTSVKTGFSFGLTSGIITTLGLMVGLNASTHSRLAVIGGIITVAVADTFSDSLSMHVSSEATRNKKQKIWESTFSTLLAKLFFALIFLIPILLFPLEQAITASVALGLILLGLYSAHIAKTRNSKPLKAVTEHIAIALGVIFATHYLGNLISTVFA